MDSFGEANNLRAARTGRRAKQAAEAAAALEVAAEKEKEMFGGETVTITDAPSKPKEQSSEAPPKQGKRMGGWGEFSLPPTTGLNKPPSSRRGVNPAYEDDRLRSTQKFSDHESESGGEDEIPMIPDLGGDTEETNGNQIAQAPSVAVNRVATFRELDHDLSKHATFTSLDNEIDLKLLVHCLSGEVDVQENDDTWDWDKLFTDVTSEMEASGDTVFLEPPSLSELMAASDGGD